MDVEVLDVVPESPFPVLGSLIVGGIIGMAVPPTAGGAVATPSVGVSGKTGGDVRLPLESVPFPLGEAVPIIPGVGVPTVGTPGKTGGDVRTPLEAPGVGVPTVGTPGKTGGDVRTPLEAPPCADGAAVTKVVGTVKLDLLVEVIRCQSRAMGLCLPIPGVGVPTVGISGMTGGAVITPLDAPPFPLGAAVAVIKITYWLSYGQNKG